MADTSLGSIVPTIAGSNITWSIFRWAGDLNAASVKDAWRTVTLNSTVENNINSCSLSSNQISLPSGKYIVTASKFIKRSHHSRVGIYDVTNTTMVIEGINTYCYPTDGYGIKNVCCEGILEPTATTVYELRYYTKENEADGIADAGRFDPSMYAIISIGRLMD